MAFPVTLLGVHTEILVNGTWVDLTAAGHVRGDDGVVITRGRSDERNTSSAGSCAFKLDNRTAVYTDDNPTGTYYGYIGRNTRCRTYIASEFTAPTAGTPTTAKSSSTTYTIASPTVADGDGILLVQSTSASIKNDVPDPTGFTLLDYRLDSSGLMTMVWMKWTRGTEPATYTLTQASGDATACAIPITGAERAVPEINWTLTTAPGSSVSTPTSNPRADNDLEVRYAAGRRAAGAATTWTAPGTHTEIVDQQQGTSTTQAVAKRALAVHTQQAAAVFTPSAATLDSAMGFVVSFAAAGAVRFDGEIPEWSPRADKTGRDQTVTIRAAGRLRRLSQGARALNSAMQRAVSSAASYRAVAYWPGEDGTSSTVIASGLSGGQPMLYSGTITFANRQIFNGSGSVLAFSSGAYMRGPVPEHTATGTITYKGLFYIPTGIATSATLVDVQQTEGSNDIGIWNLQHNTGGNLRLLGLQNGGTVVVDSAAIATDIRDKDQLIGFTLTQSGANVAWTVIQRYFTGGTLTQNTYTGTFASITLGRSTMLIVGNGGNLGSVAAGHHMIGTSPYMGEDFTSRGTGAPIALNGWGNEAAGRRIARLCYEEGIPITIIGSPDDTMRMGVQDTDKLIDLLNQAAAVDQGILGETRGGFGLTYRVLSSLYNQTGPSISYSSDYLSGELRPTKDDQAIWNSVDVARVDGSSFVIEQRSGQLNINEPEDDVQGVGTYNRGRQSLVCVADSQLPLIAGWIRYLGTWPDRRFSNIEVNFARSVWVANASLRKSTTAMIQGDLFTLTGLLTSFSVNSIDQMVQGITERITNNDQERSWEIEHNTSPAGPYGIGKVSGTTTQVDTGGSKLSAAVTSSATALLFKNTGTARWSETNEPYDVAMSGERMTVTTMTHTNIAFGTVGTATHGNNASVTPGTPASRAVGDLLVLMAAIRSTSASVTTPTGYTLPSGQTSTNFRIYLRIATNTAADLPSVSFTGGAAGDDTSAQLARFTGDFTDVSNLAIHVNPKTNGSQQNIDYDGVHVTRDNALVLVAGWKQDDWTSVASLSGFTELAEASTVTGNDQGFVWDYVIQTGRTNLAGGSFVVTGGLSAVGAAVTMVIQSDTQRATVTRSVNGVSKAQAADAAITIWSPFRASKGEARAL